MKLPDKIYALFCRTMDAYINCEIVATPGKYDFKNYAYGFQKDSPFLPLFDYYLNEMKEKGSLKQIKVKYEPPSQICPDYSFCCFWCPLFWCWKRCDSVLS